MISKIQYLMGNIAWAD